MENSNEQPHDSLTKYVLRDETNISDFLSDLLPKYVSKEIMDDMILEDAKQEDCDHISPKLKKHFSDLLFSIPLRSGGNMRVYCLIEHKSYYDKDAPLQILENITVIYRDKKFKRQPVIGILLYHGGQKWDVSSGVQRSLGFPEDIRQKFERFLPELEYIAIKVREENLLEYVQHVRIQVFLSVLLILDSKNKDEDFKRFLRFSFPLIESKDGLYYFKVLLGYAQDVYRGAKGDIVKFAKEVGKEMGSQMEELVMTPAKQFHDEVLERGRKEGIKEGVKKGFKDGRKKERAKADQELRVNNEDIAQKLKQKGFPVEAILEATGISMERLKELELKHT